MKKQQIKERFENTADSLFQNIKEFEDSLIVLNNNSVALLDNSCEEENIKKNDSIISFAKMVFLFLPGSFFLFKVTLIFAYVTMFLPHTISNYGKFDYFFVMFLIENKFLGIFFFLTACFMTFMGVGSLRETKNLIIPGLIISFSGFLFGVFSFLPEFFRGDMVQYYSIYLFPLMLLGVNFVMNWIEKTR